MHTAPMSIVLINLLHPSAEGRAGDVKGAPGLSSSLRLWHALGRAYSITMMGCGTSMLAARDLRCVLPLDTLTQKMFRVRPMNTLIFGF